MAEDETPGTDEAEAQAGAAPRVPLRPLLVAVGCVLAGSLLGAVTVPTVVGAFEQPEAGAQKVEEPAAPEEPKGVSLEEPISVMVNVADENARRVLKADIVVKAKDSAARRIVEDRAIEIKNALISLLSGKRLADLEGREAKDALRREIKLFINERLAVPDAVVQIYFDEFIVQ